MRTILSAQQLAFFRNNGFIEFEIPHDIPFSEKRDQWREDENLFRFIKNKLGKPALELSHQKKIRLGVTFWITDENKPEKGCSIQELISIQGIEIACVLSPNPIIPEKRSPLGILPIPQDSQNALFFNPKFILDWPNVDGNLFFVLFASNSSVYVENNNDTQTNYLKELGCFFGDALKNETHPLIF